MTFSTSIIRLKHQHISQLIAQGNRLDGRELTDYRDIQIEFGIIERAEGSARVHIGKTDVMVGIKIDVGEPFSDTPDEGVLSVSAELVPIASPIFEPGPPGEEAIELARVVDRGIRESEAIDLKKLCLIPGKKSLVVFVDIYVLNHDGNLVDASAIASLAALLNTKIHNYEVKNGEVITKPGYSQLPLTNQPLALSLAKIENRLIVDPTHEEEQVMDVRFTLTLDSKNNICAAQKSGNGYFTNQEIVESIQIAEEKIEDLRKIFQKELAR